MEYKIINSIDDLPSFTKDNPIFCDLETDDLYGPVRTLQVYQPQTSDLVYIVDIAPIGYDKTKYPDELLALEDFVMQHHTVWYNSSYDLGTLNISPSMGIKHPDEVTMDTKYNHKVDDLFYTIKTAYAEFKEFGLKKIVKKLRYTQGLYDGINTEDSAKGFARGAYIAQQAYKYAALDVYALSLIWEDKKAQNVIQNNIAYKVDMMSQAYALIYQQNGLQLDRQYWIKELEKAKKNVEIWKTKLPVGFNPNSYKQVRSHLGIDKSDAEALINYSLSDRKNASDATAIIKLKKHKKEVSYLTSINYDKMITKYNVAGAISGRFTSTGGSLPNGFNAQQIPRQFQYLFNSPTDDTSVIDADYSTLELRLACTIFGSEKMREQLLEGRDLHTDMVLSTNPNKKLHPDGVIKVTGTEIDNGKWVTSEDRVKAKAINFGFVFGMSANSFVPYAYTSYGVKYSLKEAEDIRNSYFSNYPEFQKHHNKMWSNYKKPNFFVYTALGRRIKPNLGTDAINIPIQGSGAETTKLALHYLIKDNPEYPILKYIYNAVHDAIYMRVPKGEEEELGDLLNKAMIKAWEEISKTSVFNFKDIPMIAEVEVYK